jgi:hypothetical protein
VIHLGLRLSSSAPQRSAASEPANANREVAIDAAIVAVFDRAVSGETIAMSYARRERELRALFERLTPDACRVLSRRLEAKVPGDQVAEHFGRMVAERRQRLVSYLDDARRREAVRSART